MVGRRQENDLLLVVDLVKDPPASDSDPPGRWFPIAQPRRGRDLSGTRAKKRIDAAFQRETNSPGSCRSEAIQVVLKGPGFEEPVVRQADRVEKPRPGVRSSTGA